MYDLKPVVIQFRISNEEQELLMRAAAIKGIPFANFIVDSAVDRAKRVLAKPRLVVSNKEKGEGESNGDAERS
jgi:uncharacterized protein (DUF1778 family)